MFLARELGRAEFERVATPGVWMTDLLLTGVYKDMSEFTRLIVVTIGLTGFELFQVASVTADILVSDLPVLCSRWLSSSIKFSSRWASYDVRL